MSAPDEAVLGRARADELLELLGQDESAARALLDGLTDPRQLAYLGAGLTELARAEGRRLPPAMKAQAATRQMHLGALRDGSRRDVAGLRSWLLSAAQEVELLRSLRTATDRSAG